MDEIHCFCVCGQPVRECLEDATYVVDGAICCSYECSRKAEDAVVERLLRGRHCTHEHV